jgi:uncharacterized protein YndB with AHSA1/START domain
MTMDLSEHPVAWFDSVLPDRDRRQPNAVSLVTTATFEAHERGAKLTVRSRFESAALRDAFARHGMSEGWGQSLDRLWDLLRGP